MPKVLPSSPHLKYFLPHVNSGGSDANSVGKCLGSVRVSSPKHVLGDCIGSTFRIGFGIRYTDVTKVGGPGNHQTFYESLENALECIFAGNSIPLPSMRQGSFTFNGFHFEVRHNSGAEFDLVLIIDPNDNNDLVNADKLKFLWDKKIHPAVLDFNSKNRLSCSTQCSHGPIQINSMLLVDCIGDNSVQFTHFINKQGWSVRSN